MVGFILEYIVKTLVEIIGPIGVRWILVWFIPESIDKYWLGL